MFTNETIQTGSSGEITVEMNPGCSDGYYTVMCRAIISDGMQIFDHLLELCVYSDNYKYEH